jgi:hypothetical protein
MGTILWRRRAGTLSAVSGSVKSWFVGLDSYSGKGLLQIHKPKRTVLQNSGAFG